MSPLRQPILINETASVEEEMMEYTLAADPLMPEISEVIASRTIPQAYGTSVPSDGQLCLSIRLCVFGRALDAARSSSVAGFCSRPGSM